MTTVSFPMVHDTLPILKIRSYLKKPQLPFLRLPGLQKIKRNEIVVFSWPADTVRQFFVKEAGVRKPIDKKSNYVKRCVAIPGDTLQIIDGLIHIDGERTQLPPKSPCAIYPATLSHNEGISARKLLDLGYKDFTRTYKIKGITQQSFNAIRPYILGTTGTSIEDFKVITQVAAYP